MQLEHYHIQPYDDYFVYYYNTVHGFGWDHPSSEVLIRTEYISLNTLLRLANQHHHRRNNA